jgi:hypothetical protein
MPVPVPVSAMYDAGALPRLDGMPRPHPLTHAVSLPPQCELAEISAAEQCRQANKKISSQ